MTYCSTLAKPLIEKIEAGETLDKIAKSLCGDTVKHPRQKVIRIIKELLDEEYLIEHAESLGYNPQKAVRTKSTSAAPVKRKIVSNSSDNVEVCCRDGEQAVSPASESNKQLVRDSLLDVVRGIVERFGYPAVVQALNEIQVETEKIIIELEPKFDPRA